MLKIRVRSKSLIKELDQTFIGQKKLEPYVVKFREGTDLDHRCLALYKLVKDSTVLSLEDRVQILHCIEKIEKSSLEEKEGTTLSTRNYLLDTIKRICRCFSKEQLEELGIDFKQAQATSDGFEISDEIFNKFRKEKGSFSFEEKARSLIQDLAQVSIQHRNLKASLKGREINLDNIFKALEDLLNVDSLPFFERCLVLSFLKKMKNLDTLPNSQENDAYLKRKAKMEAICRIFSKEQLLKWGISLGRYAREVVRVSDDTFTQISQCKMKRNAQKAAQEHLQKKTVEENKRYFLSLAEFEALGENKSLINTQQIQICSADSQGSRSRMQDAHFHIKMEEGILAGVFDGHGNKGETVAQKAMQMFKERFAQVFLENDKDIYTTFLLLTEEIHEAIVCDSNLDHGGSTAVVSFVDKSGRIYTATIGDSEAFLYRQSKEGLRCLPCSVIRDWGSRRDEKRVESVMGWSDQVSPKRRYFLGTNLSRSLGDKDIAQTRENPGLIHKPKIAMHEARRGDLFLLATDGITDFLTQEEIIGAFSFRSSQDMPSRLLDLIEKRYPGHPPGIDNQTAIVIHF